MEPEATTDVTAVLAHVTAQLPGHEDRPGQIRMAELVTEAIANERHLIVQAGTGTGEQPTRQARELRAGVRRYRGGRSRRGARLR